MRTTAPLALPHLLVEQVGNHVAVFTPENQTNALAWSQRDDAGEWRVCWPGTWNVPLQQARQMAFALATLVATMETAIMTEAPTADLRPDLMARAAGAEVAR
jgi:hypothetical protein